MQFKSFVGDVDTSVLMRATLLEAPSGGGRDTLRSLTAMYSSEASRRMSMSMPVRIQRTRSMSKDFSGDVEGHKIRAIIPRAVATGTGGYVRYLIECHDSIGSWMVYKRFRSFVHLHEQLSKQHPYANLPLLPEKRLFGNKDARFVDQRRADLEVYFTKLLSVPDLRSSSTIVHYLSRSDPEQHASVDSEGDFQTVEMFWRMACKHRWSEEVIADVLLWTQTSRFDPVELQTIPIPITGSENRALDVALDSSKRASALPKGQQEVGSSSGSRRRRRTSLWSRLGGAFETVKDTFKDTLFPNEFDDTSAAPRPQSRRLRKNSSSNASGKGRRWRRRGNSAASMSASASASPLTIAEDAEAEVADINKSSPSHGTWYHKRDSDELPGANLSPNHIPVFSPTHFQ